MAPGPSNPSGGSSDSGKMIGIIIGTIVGAVVLTVIIACCCCMCMRSGSDMQPGGMNYFAPRSNYQMPSGQQRPWFSSYGDMQQSQGYCDDYSVQPQRAPSFFQKPPNEYPTRYQGNNINPYGRPY